MAQTPYDSPLLDPFETLGLPRDASIQSIRSQYRRLARKYHPNRHPGTHGTTGDLTGYFHRVREAWDQLKDASNRKRCIELLSLLDIHNEIRAQHHSDADATDPTADSQAHSSDGHMSSDADEELPKVASQTPSTSKRGLNSGSQRDAVESPSTPCTESPSHSNHPLRDIWTSAFTKIRKDENLKSDFFTKRRQKAKRLQKREYEAFVEYRDAKIALLEAESRAEEMEERYRTARFRRQYFEDAPKEPMERMHHFRNYISAVNAFSAHSVRKPSLPDINDEISSPVLTSPIDRQLRVPERRLQRRRIKHQRVTSSDISGDQTSSEEDSPGPHGRLSASPPGRWTPLVYPRRVKELISAYQPSDSDWEHISRSDSARASRSAHRDGSPVDLKIFVRSPTGMSTATDGYDSGAALVSRSPSPQTRDQEYRESRFMILPGPSISESFFGMPQDRRSRSPGPYRPGEVSVLGTTPPANPLGLHEELQFRIITDIEPRHRGIPSEHVHQLSKADESRLLGSAASSDNGSALLLNRLEQLDAHVASKFTVKRDVIEQFNFRLVYDRPRTPSDVRDTFIALSYRRRLQVQKGVGCYSLPLEPEMFQALWNERASEEEGVWIDQICIDQDDEMERTVSMSAMDMVYKSARLIVVVLDDSSVRLTSQQAKILQSHIDEYNSLTHVAAKQRFRRKQPPYLEIHRGLFDVIQEILQFPWFARAWCRHEMRLARDHVFLIPCEPSRSGQPKEIIRFNSVCLTHLLALATEVTCKPSVELRKAALYSFFSDRVSTALGDSRVAAHHGNFSAVVAEVFAMEAGGDPRIKSRQQIDSDARKDKIAIVLNTMECGLALHPSIRLPSTILSEHGCYHDMLLLALAARDPGALCSIGVPLPIKGARSSWMYTPTVADAGLNNHKTLPRLPQDAAVLTSTRISEPFIQLDLKFFHVDLQADTGPDTVTPRTGLIYVPAQDREAMRLAKKLVEVCVKRRWGRNRRSYLLSGKYHDDVKRIFGSMLEVYVETMAAILFCGPTWLDQVCRRYGMGRWRVDLPGAWQLMVALQNTDGRWPESAWDKHAASFLMDFVNFLVIRGLPQRQIMKRELWRPVCVCHPEGGKVLTYLPVEHRTVHAAIPLALVHEEYDHLARLWVLEPREVDDELGSESARNWTLLGKSVVFSDEISIERMTSIRGDERPAQRIFGRNRTEHLETGL